MRADRSGNARFHGLVWMMLEVCLPVLILGMIQELLALGIALLQGGLVENRFGVRRSWWCSFCGGIRKAHPSSCHSSDGKANRENKPPIQSGTPRIQTLSKTAALIIRRARMCEWNMKKNIEIKLPFISLGRLSIMLSALWRCSSPLRDSLQEASRLTVECSKINYVYFSFLIYNLMRDTYGTLSKKSK